MDPLVLYDSVLFGIGHNVRRWADAVERRYTANAIAFAPVNKRLNKSSWDAEFPPGSLKASITGQVDRIGPKHLQTTISVNVPYALFVIEGTGEIFPKESKWLRLPFNAGFGHKAGTDEEFVGTASLHRSVRGQKPNNFLLLAHEATALRHPSLGRNPGAVFQQF